MKDERLERLESEDVYICTKDDADRLAFVCRKIADAGSSAVVATFDSADKNDEETAVALLRDIARNMPPTIGVLRFFAMPENEWRRFFDAHRHERFSIEPQVASIPQRRFGATAFPDFADIPIVRSALSDVAETFAASPADKMWPVMLLTGETGAGKSFAARKIYEELARTGCVKGEFVSLNCGEFGKEDMNAAIFGLKGGRFTGVPKDVAGAIEEAKDGILFLDEIGTLPMELQPRLLTLLDTGRYRKHGDTADNEQSSCRFIFGTNENLREAIAENKFRFDLFNRINGMRVSLPSVKDRINGANGTRFLKTVVSDLCRRHGISTLTRNATANFIAFARKHRWAGNFRELKRFFNILQRRMFVLVDGNVATAAMMRRTIDEMEASDEEVCSVHSFDENISPIHPLLTDLAGVAAKDKATLEFAFKCAAGAKNCRQAAERFFDGRRQNNPQTSFTRWLARFGFAYSDEAVGHIVRLGK